MFSDLETYPEIQTYTLYNVYNRQEIIVTEQMMITSFPDETERMKIFSGRSKNWILTENIIESNQINPLY